MEQLFQGLCHGHEISNRPINLREGVMNCIAQCHNNHKDSVASSIRLKKTNSYLFRDCPKKPLINQTG